MSSVSKLAETAKFFAEHKRFPRVRDPEERELALSLYEEVCARPGCLFPRKFVRAMAHASYRLVPRKLSEWVRQLRAVEHFVNENGRYPFVLSDDSEECMLAAWVNCHQRLSKLDSENVMNECNIERLMFDVFASVHENNSPIENFKRKLDPIMHYMFTYHRAPPADSADPWERASGRWFDSVVEFKLPEMRYAECVQYFQDKVDIFEELVKRTWRGADFYGRDPNAYAFLFRIIPYSE